MVTVLNIHRRQLVTLTRRLRECADEIERLQKMNEALRAALRCADEEMKAIDDDAVCDHEVGICWCTWIDAREVMRDALAQKDSAR